MFIVAKKLTNLTFKVNFVRFDNLIKSPQCDELE